MLQICAKFFFPNNLCVGLKNSVLVVILWFLILNFNLPNVIRFSQESQRNWTWIFEVSSIGHKTRSTWKTLIRKRFSSNPNKLKAVLKFKSFKFCYRPFHFLKRISIAFNSNLNFKLNILCFLVTFFSFDFLASSKTISSHSTIKTIFD